MILNPRQVPLVVAAELARADPALAVDGRQRRVGPLPQCAELVRRREVRLLPR